MKEIKFKGKSVLTGKWVYGYYRYIHRKDRNIIYNVNDEEIPIISGTQNEYIGIKDINDIEIYEGDIIQFKHYLNNIVYQGEVWYCEDFGIYLIKYYYPNRKDYINFRFEEIKKETIEILGK